MDLPSSERALEGEQSLPTQTFSVEKIIDGVKHVGRCEVTGDVITVSTGFGFKKAQLGGTPAKALAQILLSELITDERLRG